MLSFRFECPFPTCFRRVALTRHQLFLCKSTTSQGEMWLHQGTPYLGMLDPNGMQTLMVASLDNGPSINLSDPANADGNTVVRLQVDGDGPQLKCLKDGKFLWYAPSRGPNPTLPDQRCSSSSSSDSNAFRIYSTTQPPLAFGIASCLVCAQLISSLFNAAFRACRKKSFRIESSSIRKNG
jgi:hypothetical protein